MVSGPHPFHLSSPRRPALRSNSSSFLRGNNGISGPSAGNYWREASRATNLAVTLLGGLLILSLLFNLRLWLGDEVFRTGSKEVVLAPMSIRATLGTPRSALKHLIIVPGHALWIGEKASEADTNEGDWLLEPFQSGDGSIATYISHITKGVELAVKDTSSLLVFSGGQTRAEFPVSEASGYARLAAFGNFYAQFGSKDSKAESHTGTAPFERVTTEEYALDSHQNLLFSIARFKEFTGRYPTQITVVGFGMKRKRYESIHRTSIRYPATAFRYIGIDNAEENAEKDYAGEKSAALEPFTRDRYGCKGNLLAKKRTRNALRRFHGYFSSAPELADLLDYCPKKDNEVFPGRLPWD